MLFNSILLFLSVCLLDCHQCYWGKIVAACAFVYCAFTLRTTADERIHLAWATWHWFLFFPFLFRLCCRSRCNVQAFQFFRSKYSDKFFEYTNFRYWEHNAIIWYVVCEIYCSYFLMPKQIINFASFWIAFVLSADCNFELACICVLCLYYIYIWLIWDLSRIIEFTVPCCSVLLHSVLYWVQPYPNPCTLHGWLQCSGGGNSFSFFCSC